MTGLYIHIPFCSGKCKYCDFVSFPDRRAVIPGYLSALEKEAETRRSLNKPETLYVGGGTPGELSAEEIERLLSAVEKIFRPVLEFRESTFEMNPESAGKDKISVLRSFGINRVSMGLQSFDDAILSKIGRRHNTARFLLAYEELRRAGFTGVNVDLIAGIPWQKNEDFARGLSRLIQLRPEHISVYGLEISDTCALGKEGVQTDDDLCRTDLETARAMLCAAGYHHYEISNFALPGFESMHNTNYWQNGDYTGLGCAAASYLSGERSANTPDLDEYIARAGRGQSATVSSERLEGKEKTGESIILGLRQLDGISLDETMLRQFGAEFDRLQNRGLLITGHGMARLSHEGIYMANEVFRHFVAPFGEQHETAHRQP